MTDTPEFHDFKDDYIFFQLEKAGQKLEISACNSSPVVLLKQDAIRLAAEITHWCETGHFIEHLHEYVAVIEDIGIHHSRDNLHIRTVKAKDKEAAIIKAVCDWIPNPNLARLVGVLPLDKEEKP